MAKSTTDKKKLLQQIQNEYEEGRSFLETKKERWVKQLKLMNNLQRGDENIASTMLFSYFTRVLSNLYENKMNQSFMPSEDSEFKVAEELNKLSQFDYTEMDKEVHDYDWLWDSLFFGQGYSETLNFDKKRKLLRPTIINPLMMYYDPYFSHHQSWRYYGKWVLKNRKQIEDHIENGTIDGIKKVTEITRGVEEKVWDYKVRREQAKDANSASQDTNSEFNGIYQILEHYTYFEYEGEFQKVVCWLDKDMTKILRVEPLHDILGANNPDNENDCYWPIVPKTIFREPHSSLPVSIPDIIEDKHRAQNVILNLAYISAKDEGTPLYAYDKNKIDDVTQFYQRQILQHIAVDGDPSGAITPVKKQASLSSATLQFINIMKNESAEAIGTTNIAQPIQKGKKTATSDALLQQIADLTASLQGKIMLNAEKEWWGHWYQQYINNIKEGDKKIISTTHISGMTFETIKLSELKTKYPPKVIITPSKEAEFKHTIERREIAQQLGIVAKSVPPAAFIMFLKHIYFPKFQSIDSESLDLIFPKSVGELQAERENLLLNKGITVPVQPTDEDEIHLYIHARATRNPETWAHILTHEQSLAMKQAQKQQQAQQAQEQPAQPEQQDQSQPQGGGGKKGKMPAKDMTPDEAATPLKGVMEKVGKESKISSNISPNR